MVRNYRSILYTWISVRVRDHDSDRSPNYLDAKEVVELLHVRHLELVKEEGFDLVDVNEMPTSNDYIIYI